MASRSVLFQKLLVTFVLVAVAYMLIGAWVSKRMYEKYIHETGQMLLYVSKDDFKDTQYLRQYFQNREAGYCKSKLMLMFPFGAYYRYKILHMENGILFFSENYTKSPDERYLDDLENELYGANSEGSSDEQVMDDLTKFFGEFSNGGVCDF